MDEPKKTYAEQVAEKVIEQLKQGTAPWQKPWSAGEFGTMPMNPTTGNRYKGINAINLMMQGQPDPRWMTYNQAQELGGQVRKGEKGTMIQYWKFQEERIKKDDNGRPVLNAEGEKVKETVQLDRPKCFNAFVFNASQIDGLPEMQKKEQSWSAVERAEHILAASGAKITHAAGDRAFYRLSTDSITMPERGQFDTADNYYATALHELGHWTGHPSRLDRDLTNPFGSEGYAKEELRAEIASMIIGDELGIGHDPGQHVSYVKSWIKALQDDPLEIFRAAADAEKIQKFVLAFEQKQVQTEQQTQEHEAVLVHLSEQRNTGALRGWKALDAKAQEQGIRATLSWSNLGDADPDVRVTYQDGANTLPLETQLHSRTGEGRTMLVGEMMPWGDLPDYKEQHVAKMNAGIYHYKTQTNPQQIEQEQAEVLAHIQQTHLNANPGYSALESWQTLEEAARHLVSGEVQAVLRWNPGVDEYDPDIRIDYLEPDGKRLAAYTELNSGDGKAVTHYKEGKRVPGTGMTTEPEWQVASLVAAVQMARQQAQEAGMAQPNTQKDSTVNDKQLIAERWILDRVVTPGEQLGSLPAAIGRMNDKQLDTTMSVLDAMHPLGNDNEFWQRHETAAELMFNDVDQVEERIFAAKDAIEAHRQAIAETQAPSLASTPASAGLNSDDARLAEALKSHRAEAANSAQGELEPFRMALGGETYTLPIPGDWTGLIQIREESVIQTDAEDPQQTLHSVFAHDSNNEYRWIAGVASAELASEMAERLALISAHGHPEETEQAAALARIHEEQVGNDPNSTDEDLSAAKEARKNAEMASMLNDADLQRRIAELEKQVEQSNIAQDKTWLAIPYEERQQAKDAAGKLKGKEPAITFDDEKKCWYAKPGADLDKLKQWLPQNRPTQAPAMNWKEEFANAMRDAGLTVPKDGPVADGKIHRVAVQGGSKGNTSGAYKLFDVAPGEKGVPAGYIENFKTGVKTTWKSKGYNLSDNDRAAMAADAAKRNAERERERQAAQERSLKAVKELLAIAPPAKADHTYLNNKAARPGDLQMVPADTSSLPKDTIILIGKNASESRALRKNNPDNLVFTAGDLLLTAQNAQGELQSVQSIRANGTKMMCKGTEKAGGFHVVGGQGMDSLKSAPAIVIAEGFATADTVSSAVNFPVVAAFDSGNLPKVAQQLRSAFPDKPFVIMGDNDAHQEIIDGKNPGRTKALEAAEAVGGRAVFPTFAPGERDWPANVPPIDQKSYKENSLSQEQKDAHNKLKTLTDFNDLALKSEFGREGMQSQVKAAVEFALHQAQERDQAQELKPEQVEKLEQVKQHKLDQQQRRPRRAM